MFNLFQLGGGSGFIYCWNFGNGTQMVFFSQLGIIYSYNCFGYYIVIFMVCDVLGCEIYYIYNVIVIFLVMVIVFMYLSNIVGDVGSVYVVNFDSGIVVVIDVQVFIKCWEICVGDEFKIFVCGFDGCIWVMVQGEDKLVVLNLVDGSFFIMVVLFYGSGFYGVVFMFNGVKGLLMLESKFMLISFDLISGNIMGMLVLEGELCGIVVVVDLQMVYIICFELKMMGG